MDDQAGARPSAPKEDEAKLVWQKPAVASVIPLVDAKGNGIAGTDFASELS